MRIRSPQDRPLALGATEIAVQVQPRPAGRVDAGPQRRMNAFAGRALTAPLLNAEQDHRARRVALLWRALSAGVVDGLALAFDEAALAPIATAADPPPAAGLDLAPARPMQLEPGVALDAAGEEVVVPSAVGFDALALPLVAPNWLLDGEAPPPAGVSDGSRLDSRRVGRALRTELAAGRALPRAGLVLLQAIETHRVDGTDPFDQCERDLDAEAFEDQQRQDGGRLLFYAWPDEWLPLWAPDVAWRNRLAHALFDREAALGDARSLPWLAFGVPLALVAFNAGWQPLFADRAAVVRAGGRPREADPVRRRGSGDRYLWQARIEQLTEHLAESRAAGADIAALASELRRLPPAGLLPADAMDVRARVQRFFPPAIDVVATPVPLEQLDLVLEESAGLAPIDLALRERLQVHVPVPQALYDPDLLVVERADTSGEIGQTLARFVEARGDWLRRRQALRGKEHALRAALDGAATPSPPAMADDPLRLEDEAPGLAADAPPPAGLLHRSARADGMHQHFVDGIADALVAGAEDRLYAWVLIDREQPPQQLMLQFHTAAGGWEHRAYWGASRIAWGSEGTGSRLQQSAELPAPRWTRVSVPAAALGLVDRSIDGIAFTLYGGRACFGPAGLLRGTAESPWLTAARLATGRQHGDGEGWDLVADADRDAPFEAAFGTASGATANNAGREASELATLRADADIAALRIDPPGQGRADARTLAQLIAERGLRALVQDLAGRLDEADDAINLGYLRVQTDLYRLRQSVLKQTQATRFAVSPALTQIADLDNASATREQLADFYAAVKSGQTQVQRDEPAPVFGTRATVLAAAAAVAPAPAPMFTARLLSRDVSFAAAAAAPPPAPAPSGVLGTRLARQELNLAALRELDIKVAPSPSVTDADAITGKAEIRTSSIAARMERPRSVEAKDFTVATRFDIVGKLAALGLDMDELEVTGLAVADGSDAERFDAVGQPRRTGVAKLGALRDARYAGVLSDPDPQDTKRDESAYFLGGVDLSDHTIALLRRAEGVVRRYRDAWERCRKALVAIEPLLGQAQARLAVAARELAEARQDVATARALLAEEQQRADALNAARDRVIAEQVRFLAFARPRLARRSIALPSRPLDSALEPDAVPACLADHGAAPAELQAMLAVLRQAPLDWFPAIRRQLPLLVDRLELADGLIASLRAPALSFTSATVAAPLAQVAFAASSAQFAVASQARLAALPQAQAALGGGVGLVAKLALIGRAASLHDLLAGALAQTALQRRAAEEFERIEAVASCLHARLSGVRAALRLEWAEQFSQFDAARGALDLGDLTTLPRFGELPAEQREDLRELAAWLRGRADAGNPRAVAALADLVRVCVLAASLSPVGEIVAGRVVRPLPLRPGVMLDVRPLLPDKLRIGMQVRLFDADRVAGSAVVADIVDGVAAVQITQATVAGFVPTAATAVQFLAR